MLKTHGWGDRSVVLVRISLGLFRSCSVRVKAPTANSPVARRQVPISFTIVLNRLTCTTRSRCRDGIAIAADEIFSTIDPARKRSFALSKTIGGNGCGAHGITIG